MCLFPSGSFICDRAIGGNLKHRQTGHWQIEMLRLRSGSIRGLKTDGPACKRLRFSVDGDRSGAPRRWCDQKSRSVGGQVSTLR